MHQVSEHRWLTSIAVIWRFGIVVLGTIGLLLGFHPFNGNPNTGMFRYFTNLSNAVVVVYFICALVAMFSHGHGSGNFVLWPVIKNTATMGLLVTMLIALALLGGVMKNGHVDPALLLLHLIVPLMTFFDWLLFDPKGGMHVWEPVAWLGWPFAYLIVSMAIAPFDPIRQEDGRYIEYPYPFVDVSALGAGRVVLNVVVLIVLFIAFGYVLFGLDRLLARIGSRHGRQLGAVVTS